jgi:long-chain acyl-CoA synthetase
MINLASVLEDSAREVPGKEAVIFGQTRLTYAQLHAAANQVAHGLTASGVVKGDKIAVSCPNLPFFPIVYFGILQAGAAVVPLNVLFKKDEIAYHLEDSQAVGYFCFQGTDELPIGQMGHAAFSEVDTCRHFWLIESGAPHALEGVETLAGLREGRPVTGTSALTEPGDTAVILYTSGTTGQPKGAELSHANIMMNAVSSKEILQAQEDDIHLVCLPLFHSFGQVCQLVTGFYCRATLVLMARFEPGEAWTLMDREGVTVFCGVPTMYWSLLEHGEADQFDIEKIAAKMRLAVSGGAAMPVEIMRAFEERFQVPILEGYGLSESSPVATFSRIGRERKPGSVGLPIWGVTVKIVDDQGEEVAQGKSGQILLRGHNVMKGYYRREEATAETIRDGWLHTGDVGQLDEDGYLYIVDRVKDMIIRGGFNVYPRELEEVLVTHPDISLAAVIGIPDQEHGEEVKAYIVPKQGAELDAASVIAWSKEHMAAYKYPRVVEIRDGLPMTATGKILKKELRKEI